MREKGIVFSAGAKTEMDSLSSATAEIVEMSYLSFINEDTQNAMLVEPLEQVIDRMKELLRTRHIDRLRVGECSIEAGLGCILKTLVTVELQLCSDFFFSLSCFAYPR